MDEWSLLRLGIAVIGLFLPGYLVARALCLPAAWAAAMPLSAGAICASVVALACCDAQITAGRVACGLAGITVAAALGWRLGGDLSNDCPAAAASPPWFSSGRAILIGFCGLIAAVVALRATLEPLSGPDTSFRWDWLARQVLVERSLGFYPPRTAHDFELYFYPDGMPPLVASTYWWLYAAVGRPLPAVTGIAVAAQFASLLGLVWRAARLFHGGRAGLPAAALVAACPLVIFAVGIGQETGFTSLAVAGQAACGLAAARSGSGRTALGCGLFAALGGCARDYGPALSICGLLLLAETGHRRRTLPAFLAGAAVALPWFLRNWWLTGNPVYPIPTPFGLPSNEPHAALMSTYAAAFSVFAANRDDLVNLAQSLAIDAGAVLALGLAGAFVVGRRGLPLVATAALTAALWAWSTGFTAGGVYYSLRVLAPAMVALALLAPAAAEMARCIPTRFVPTARFVGFASAAIVGVFAIVVAAIFPTDVTLLPYVGGLSAIPSHLVHHRPDPLDDQGKVNTLVKALNGSSFPTSGILTDNPYMAVVLTHTGSRFRPVMVWSPEVAFLFERGDARAGRGVDGLHAAAAVRKKLAEREVFLVMIATDFLHWRVLGRLPFFEDDEPTWRPVFILPGDRPDAGICVMPSVWRAAEP
jgi:hypothetical protein